MRELCPFDLAPVTSTAIQMLFGDTVAIALMQVIWRMLPFAYEVLREGHTVVQHVVVTVTCCGCSCHSP